LSLLSLLFSFKGRANRVQYWLGSLGVGLVSGTITAVMLFPSTQPAEQIIAQKAEGALPAHDLGVSILVLIISLASAWCGVAIQVKRFHDRGQSGLWTLLPLLPLLGLFGTLFSAIISNQLIPQAIASVVPYLIALLVINFGFFINLGCLPGTDGPNKYGDGPGSAPSSPAPVPGAKPRQQADAASAIFGNAEQAMQRAIAERQQTAAKAPANAPRPAMAGAPGAPASFGRKAAR
jgi:uncharacterized membrane protein YhaH (DUF805 family)